MCFLSFSFNRGSAMSFLKSIVNGVQAWTGTHGEISKILAPIGGQLDIIMNLRKMLQDPNATIARIAEIRKWVNALHRLVGPELRKVTDYHEIPFSTISDILKNGDRLLKGVAVIKETVAKLQELAEINRPTDSQPASGDC
jgi:hypothetical protein